VKDNNMTFLKSRLFIIALLVSQTCNLIYPPVNKIAFGDERSVIVESTNRFIWSMNDTHIFKRYPCEERIDVTILFVRAIILFLSLMVLWLIVSEIANRFRKKVAE
jgi:hypothetical protein